MTKYLTSNLEKMLEALTKFTWYTLNIETKLGRRLKWKRWQVALCLDVLEEIEFIVVDRCRCGETRITSTVGGFNNA